VKYLACIFLLFINVSDVLLAQEIDTLSQSKFQLVRKYSGRPIKMNEFREFTVRIQKSDSTYTILDGSISGLKDSTLLMNVTSEYHRLFTTNYRRTEEFFYDEEKFQKVPIQQIRNVNYESDGTRLCAALITLSLVSAFIVAPLVSIDYKAQDGFNSFRNRRIRNISLGGAALGAVLLIPINMREKIEIRPIKY
jgi:hypothetical protein